jgi:integrase
VPVPGLSFASGCLVPIGRHDLKTCFAFYRAMAQTGDGLIAIRDRALLLLGFAMAARRSELSALEVADIADDPAGLLITIRGGKTDQERKGATVAVVRGEVACPVEALKAWVSAAGITEGPVFRPINRHRQVGSAALSGISIGQIVQRQAERIGLDPKAYGGHSLRAGFVTSAAKRGANVFKLMISWRAFSRIKYV